MAENVSDLEFVPLLLAAPVVPPVPPVELSRALRRERQAGDYLCWAAAAVSVSHFFDAASGITQCRMANIMRERRNEAGECCPDPAALVCDQPVDMAEALDAIGNLAGTSGGPFTFDLIGGQVEADRPVALVKDIHVVVVYRGSRSPITGKVALEVFDPLSTTLDRTLILTNNEQEIQVVCLTTP